MQFLAVLKVKPDAPRGELGPLLKPEAQKVWEMLSSNVVRSAHYIDGGEGPVGAVLLLEVGAREEAEAHVNRLPMVEHGLLSVEILQLGPFTGLATLFTASA